ncbi:cytochrome c-type biogenesis protein CcmH [Ketogulonicigenium robustum]|uniref:Cytochrome c-type biogenesis protein n=1 Tax=Ketogulonicigenium robustum TaxID=92947 RepID=A0A1W6P195_9RHOB|nr:cytochrome c-type biogenesis protein [Ketogulonicigenium robustum]ARO15057.1 cytochrome c-type biogenesis protein CcmH [Ketogulonicigenium robustum]
MKRIVLALSLCLAVASPVWAVQPDEVLSDPGLEARARHISAGLRCLVCQNENIDDSNAQLARDLRLLVRERLVAGDTDAEAIDHIVARYGEYVLLRPRMGGMNNVLWGAAPAMFLMALGVAVIAIRRRARAEAAPPLTEDEKKRLDELLK